MLRMSRLTLELPSGRNGLLVSLPLPPLPPGVSAIGCVSAILGTDAALGVVGPLGVWVVDPKIGVPA